MKFTLTKEVMLNFRQKEHQRLKEPQAFDLFLSLIQSVRNF